MAFQIDKSLPYCPGCGHHQIARSTAEAFEKLGWNEKDVILVTDIGCVGLADRYFSCHTIHGLHGRSVPLAEGIRFGSPDTEKHIVVFIGDGGATIGLQHLLEAARLNVEISVVVFNNMLYGMTGGQSSGFTPEDYKTTTEPEGSNTENYDLPELTHDSGASYSCRITTGAGENLTETMAEAFSEPGFSLIEVIESCYSYGHKYNPDYTMEELLSDADLETGTWRNKDKEVYQPEVKEETPSLLKEIPDLEPSFQNSLNHKLSVLIGGSAGEGIQTASGVLSKAAILSDLEVAKKGEYPVTVGSGFSTAKVILSPENINFTGCHSPDVAIITSEEGLKKNREMVEGMTQGRIYMDDSLPSITPGSNVEITGESYREAAGGKGAALCAITDWLSRQQILPRDSLKRAANNSEHTKSLKKSIQSSEKLRSI